MLTDRNRFGFVYLKRRSFANCRCSNKTGITKCFETLFYFEEKIDYGKIRLALAILEKENAVHYYAMIQSLTVC
jgi:hypothetical protein